MRALLALLLALALLGAEAAPPVVLRPMRGYKTQKEAADTAAEFAKLVSLEPGQQAHMDWARRRGRQNPVTAPPAAGAHPTHPSLHAPVCQPPQDATGRKAHFDAWKAAWAKTYATPAEEAKAFTSWSANL